MIKSYNELSVGKYLEIRELLKQDIEEMELQGEIISILDDTTVDEVMKYPLEKYSECVRNTAFLMEKPITKAGCPKSIILNDVKYEVIRKAEELTAAQYIDYQTYMKMDDPDSRLAEILSIFIIPKGKAYADGYDIKDVINAIKEYLPITIAFNVCFFFRKKQADYIRRTLIYLGLMMKIWKRKAPTSEQKQMLIEVEKQVKNLQGLLGDGVGFTTLTE